MGSQGRKKMAGPRNPWRIEWSIQGGYMCINLKSCPLSREKKRLIAGYMCMGWAGENRPVQYTARWRGIVKELCTTWGFKEKKFELTCKFSTMNMTCLPYNPFLKLLRTSTREVLGFVRRGHLEAVLPRENAGMDGADCHVTTDRQIHAVLCERKNTI